MNILAIESSCDETAAAVVKNGQEILSNVVVSQIDIFKSYGGVIPEVAARSHLEAVLPVVHEALEKAQLTWDDIDAIAVTNTPGLLGSLLIGTLTARTLAILHEKPLYAVHHLKSHIYACWLGKFGTTFSEEYKRSAAGESCKDSPRETLEENVVPNFPLLALVVSGGHTQIIYMKKHNDFKIIGTTRDDAVGECFDKVAKILGLPYPGGPSIAKAAEKGDPNKYKLPHPKLDNPYDFSFSGLKTAVLRAVQKELNKPISFPSHELAPLLSEQQIADFAASFQKTAVDILLENLQAAQQDHPDVNSIIIAGGVSANTALREKTSAIFGNIVASPQPNSQHLPSEHRTVSGAGRTKCCEFDDGAQQLISKNCCVFFPESSFSGDNAAMVGAAAYYEIQSGIKPTDPYSLTLSPRSEIH